MIMKCKKQFIALFMAISVIFCVGSESYIKAEALEWAIPTITAGEAIKWLLGLLGVTVAGAALADTDYEQLAENYTEYAHQQGLSAVETGKFWANIIDGTLDQGSQAWTTFKEWAHNLVINGLSISGITPVYTDINDIFNLYNLSVSSSVSIPTGQLGFCMVTFNPTQNKVTNINAFYNCDVVNITSNGSNIIYLEVDNANNAKRCNFTLDSAGTTILNVNTNSTIINSTYQVNLSTSLFYYCFNYTGTYPSISNLGAYNSKLSFDSVGESFINSLALTLSSAISDAIPDVIPLPWDQVSDTAEGINDKINELIEKVNEGVLSLEEYMIAIQSILGVIAFDTTNDLIVPADPDLPDETIQDKINENVNNNGFVLTGLENFFPFCIPFDIYSFITILVAEPVAPVIHWHIYNPVTKTDNIMTLDFAVWEPVVILFRYIFDFLFIIGLALIARSLIGGDD